jgi:hypothetical protein
MGLDMYALVRNEEIEEDADFDPMDEDQEVHYWRKHPNLHGWMEELYRQKNGKEKVFNCVSVKITLEDLDALEASIKDDDLPHTEGFFFGKSNRIDERIEDDMDFIVKARNYINEGCSVYYTSWW